VLILQIQIVSASCSKCPAELGSLETESLHRKPLKWAQEPRRTPPTASLQILPCWAEGVCPFRHDVNTASTECEIFLALIASTVIVAGSNTRSPVTSPATRSTVMAPQQTPLLSGRPANSRATEVPPVCHPPPIRGEGSEDGLAQHFIDLSLASKKEMSPDSGGKDPVHRLSVDAPVFVPRGLPAVAAGLMTRTECAVPSPSPNEDHFSTSYPVPSPLSATADPFQQPETGSENKGWAHIVNPDAMDSMTVAEAESQLCPFGQSGECRFGGEACAYVHGQLCEMCGRYILHPTHQEQRSCHEYTCLRQHELDMEQSFAIARSRDKTCGICMEVVVDKQPKSRARFGIMPNCNHCFCLDCLRTWRQAKQFEHKIVRACPECRQTSDYICASRVWVDTKEEKDRLLTDYRKALNDKECKYFKRGDGQCPFGNKCFYKHVDRNRRHVDVGPPPRRT